MHRALTSQPIVIWGDGEVVRDYIHVSDVASAMVSLATLPCLDNFHTFNIGGGAGTSLNGIIAELEKCLNRRLEVRREPGRPFDVPISILDIARARSILGWVPRLTLAEGIAQTMSDFARNAVLSELR
jgi:UDP-glucose 4-epimerase